MLLSIQYITLARARKREFDRSVYDFIVRNPGRTNTEYARLMGLEHISQKKFITHYTNNTPLIVTRRIFRRIAAYYPTQQRQLNNAVAIAQTPAELLESIADLIAQFARARYDEFNAVCNIDIARELEAYETLTGYHKGWFTWELLQSVAEREGFRFVKFRDMTQEEQLHVQQDNNHPLKKFIVISPENNQNFEIQNQNQNQQYSNWCVIS